MELEQIFIKKKFKKLLYKYFLFIFLLIIALFQLKNNQYYKNYFINNNIKNSKNSNSLYLNKKYIYKYSNDGEYFYINDIKYFFSLQYKMMKIEYTFSFYDKYNNLILPSDLVLYYYLHIICIIETNAHYSINSLASIYKDKYFKCIEFFDINEINKLGIEIHQIKGNVKYSTFFFFNEKIYKFSNYINLFYQNDNIFDPIIINDKYNNKYLNKNLKVMQSYLQYPYCGLKRDSILFNNEWIFKNIYNEYFCFCKGNNCLNAEIRDSCKFPFYLYIIDNNQHIYQKTDYLFLDFVFADLSSDDVYPIFEKMFNLKFPVHYITEKKEIYYFYCKRKRRCLTILPVKKELRPINGNFLEKYLTLFLKLKIVVSGRGTTFNTNLFYNIEYITYICVGHGVCYFKYYLYNKDRIYGIHTNNKILLPPSEKVISIAKKYGWKDEDIIKMNLPRWDKFIDNEYKSLLSPNININRNSIFVMFTWRYIKKWKSISNYYINNIMKLIINDKLNYILKKKNLTLYLSFHRLIDMKYIKIFRSFTTQNKYIQFIEQNEISECLKKTSLVISDFSSIIFDLIYRRKPFIIFIPDANDPMIEELYSKDYIDLIQSMKNGTIYFENKFFDINEAINKVYYYINNNFELESNLKIFYDSFGLKKENGIIYKFIDYLANIN